MNRRIIAPIALGVVLALSGCSAETAEQPASSDTEMTSSTTPPVPESVTPSPSSTTPPPGEAGTSSVQAYCQTVQGYQRQATEALNQLPRQPQSLRDNLSQLETAREQLENAEETAPASLQQYVNDQVDALDQLVDRARTGDVQSLDPQEYTDSVRDFVAQCDLVS